MIEPFDRGEKVQVRMRGTGVAWIRAKVLLDLGGDELVVARATPRSARRVPRDRVRSEERKPAGPSKVEREKPPEKTAMQIAISNLYTSDGPNGLCALQRQANPPRKGQMVDGTWAVCGEWLTSRSAPKKREPTCPDCLQRVRQAMERTPKEQQHA